jgi:hypothetical protein
MATTGFKMFAWAPDGIYDHQENQVRYVVKDGCVKGQTILSKNWVDIGPPDDVQSELKQPWGTFPDIPPKPPKK